MKLSDIPINEVLEQQLKFSEANRRGEIIPWTYEVLGEKYGSEKLVLKKMEQLADRGYLEYGVSLRTAWLTEKGLAELEK